MGNVSIWDEHPPTPQLRGLDAILSVTQPPQNRNWFRFIHRNQAEMVPDSAVIPLGNRYETFWYWILQRGMVSPWDTSLLLWWKNMSFRTVNKSTLQGTVSQGFSGSKASVCNQRAEVILVIQVLVLWCCYGSGIWHLRRCCCRGNRWADPVGSMGPLFKGQ
jgi:hypothetical protein